MACDRRTFLPPRTRNSKSPKISVTSGSETPPRISAVDVVEAITGKTKNNARNSLDCVRERYPEVARNLSYFRFPGRGQRDMPVVDVRGTRNKQLRISVATPLGTPKLTQFALTSNYLAGASETRQ